MHMVGHQAVGPYVNTVIPAPLSHQVNIYAIIRIIEKCPLASVTPLDDVMRIPWGDYSRGSGHIVF